MADMNASTEAEDQKSFADHETAFGILKILGVYHPQGGVLFCFRGHADASWKLLPKVGRPPLKKDNLHGLGMLHVWEQKAVSLCDLPDSPWERMAIAQHHGLATPLLDWTTNPLVALFFACISHRDKDGVVLIYSPNRFVNGEAPPDKMPVGTVAAYLPRAISPRITNQSGVFTFHSSPTQELVPEKMDGLENISSNLSRIVIASRLKGKVLEILDTFGVSSATLFPDLDGLSRYVNWTYE